MKNKIKKILKITIVVAFVIWAVVLILSFRKVPDQIKYGVSFNTLYARELGLDWKEVYDAILDDLGVTKIRLAAHWNLIEPEDDNFSFEEIDYQVSKASQKDVEIILAIGKRLPRWPECHVPSWAQNLNQEDSEKEILEYMSKVVERYKGNKNIKIWQVENEPFLSIYAKDHCNNFNKDFLDKEIEFVKSLDPSRDILITDSGELSTWVHAYKRGDMFGTTLYIYAWNKFMGDFRNFVWPGFYSLRRNVWNMVYGKKESIIAELSLEPWLDKSVVDETMDIQKGRMSQEKFNKVLNFASKTGFETQYLWGAEWWYYMKLHDDDWYWNRGKEIFDPIDSK